MKIIKAAFALLIATLFSVGLFSFAFAKYTSEVTFEPEGPHIAGFGTVKLQEHKAELKNGIYVLSQTVLTDKNTYDKVLPGVDIPKDPFVVVNGKFEVSAELYIKVVEQSLPAAVTYEISETDWGTPVKEERGTDGSVSRTYKYVKSDSLLGQTFEDKEISILTDNIITVNQTYNGEAFSLIFTAWVEQVD